MFGIELVTSDVKVITDVLNWHGNLWNENCYFNVSLILCSRVLEENQIDSFLQFMNDYGIECELPYTKIKMKRKGFTFMHSMATVHLFLRNTKEMGVRICVSYEFRTHLTYVLTALLATCGPNMAVSVDENDCDYWHIDHLGSALATHLIQMDAESESIRLHNELLRLRRM